jgi:CO/xanthine dehydrogenase Mo-binding subunit
MARQLDIDSITFRLHNVAEAGDPTGSGRPWPSLGLRQVLEALQAHPLWQQRHTEPGEGIGVAIGGWGTVAGTAEAICRVDSDGTVAVELGHVDVSGNDSSVVLIVAETLGVRPEDVIVHHGGTTGGAYGPNSGGSQVTYTIAGAVEGAAQVVRTKLLHIAASEFEADVEDIELSDGEARVKGVPDRAIPISRLATIARQKRGRIGPIVGSASSAPQTHSPATAAHLIKVRVDFETGEIIPLQYVVAQDVGFAINPTMVEGQMHGGMAQGVGMGLYEAFVYDEGGQLLTGSFLDYNVPRSDSTPTLEAIMVENPTPDGPFGARGVGEAPITGGLAAVANAIFDATGVRLTSAPLRPEMVWRGLQAQRETSE